MSEAVLVTVSQLTSRVSRDIAEDKALADVRVRGEVTNFSDHGRTGHLFFSLTDGESLLKCVMFATERADLRNLPKNGDVVTVRGGVRVFVRDGVYQLYVRSLQQSGEGDSAAKLQELYDKLKADGVFGKHRSLPPYPETIALVTSATGAAITDICAVAARRYPGVWIQLFDTAVQGGNAALSLVASLQKAGCSGADLIIFGRGGGSAEDLSVFNDERVVRAVYASPIPTVSAVGHERDITLCDHAADVRAATPTMAAEYAVPDMIAEIQRRHDRLERFAKLIVFKETEQARRLSDIKARLTSGIESRIGAKRRELESYAALIEARNPESIFAKGYAAVFKGEQAVRNASDVNSGDELTVRLASGIITVVVK
ncbi:MAG: exodeoxyribonuclease VII large subunit [Oscillospiraceae bacterium]|jgi:exodeoxyribonuclease VII large subunit|nr:exodeoxyribonuclease VII large subunit [Oscillospiraceae bacterium]